MLLLLYICILGRIPAALQKVLSTGGGRNNTFQKEKKFRVSYKSRCIKVFYIGFYKLDHPNGDLEEWYTFGGILKSFPSVSLAGRMRFLQFFLNGLIQLAQKSRTLFENVRLEVSPQKAVTELNLASAVATELSYCLPELCSSLYSS